MAGKEDGVVANETCPKRIDSASRVIKASPETLYRALLDPTSLVSWLPPRGMKADIEKFEPREGGSYRMVLSYEGAHSARGKSSEHSDVVEGRFVELVPNVRILQRAEFESDDPAFAGPMTMTWSLTPVPAGTEVAVSCENVPDGISKEDHAAGLESSLANLAAFVE
jgi:uncharacterized protein YndB with AHSA1/START domain